MLHEPVSDVRGPIHCSRERMYYKLRLPGIRQRHSRIGHTELRAHSLNEHARATGYVLAHSNLNMTSE